MKRLLIHHLRMRKGSKEAEKEGSKAEEGEGAEVQGEETTKADDEPND